MAPGRSRQPPDSSSDASTPNVPSSYGPPVLETAASKEEEPIIPHPDVFTSTSLAHLPVAGFITQSGGMAEFRTTEYIPTVAQCAAHLELLGCFSKLRSDVESSEVIGKWLLRGPDVVSSEPPGAVIKWRAFVAKATERFHKWWMQFPQVVKKVDDLLKAKKDEGNVAEKEKGNQPVGEKTRVWDILRRVRQEDGVKLDSELAKGLESANYILNAKHRTLTMDTLPPLDVLMVWHSFTLNPRAFYEDCIRLDRLDLWGIPLPWDLIYDVIDSYNFTYELSPNAAAFFTEITGEPADLYNTLLEQVNAAESQPLHKQSLFCPWCEKNFEVNAVEWFADGDVGTYNGPCNNCGKMYEQETLASWLLLKDVHEYFVREKYNTTFDPPKVPEFVLRGSILHPNTGHYSPEPPAHLQTQTYPSQALISGVLLSAFPSLYPTTLKTLPELVSLLNHFPSTSHILSHILNHIHLAKSQDEADSPIPLLKRVLTVIVNTYKHLPPPSVRTPVSFSTDLGAAVLRQGEFIRKIHDDARMIRSPALSGTISRSRERYHKFFCLIGKYRGTLFVPTNDIDLIWHTHQGYPRAYYIYSNLVTGIGGDGSKTDVCRFIDHNDRLAKGLLGDAFGETKKIWRNEYGNDRPLNGWARMFRGGKRKSTVVDGDGDGDDVGKGSEQEGSSEDRDSSGKYAICVCWTCEMRREKRLALKQSGGTNIFSRARFSNKDEWFVRATVYYYRAVEQARKDGKSLPVWRNKQPSVST